MKIVVFTDIHANLPALEALITELNSTGYDLLIHLGDSINAGPFPSETIDMLSEIPKTVLLRGNHENFVLLGNPLPLPEYMDKDEAEHIEWTTNQLSYNQIKMIRSWPYVKQLECEGVSLCCVHYGLTDNLNRLKNIVTEQTIENYNELFSNFDDDIILFGHDHLVMNLKGNAHYINPGSAGCYKKPFVRYCTIEFDCGKYDVTFKEIPYDKERTLSEFHKRDVPAREFIIKHFY